jgi:hypothetical protein
MTATGLVYLSMLWSQVEDDDPQGNSFFNMMVYPDIFRQMCKNFYMIHSLVTGLVKVDKQVSSFTDGLVMGTC